MSEATWDEEAKTPSIDWSVSAAFENVTRGGQDVAEVTSLENAVREWLALDAGHQAQATLTIENPILLEGVLTSSFTGRTILALAEHLPSGTAVRIGDT